MMKPPAQNAAAAMRDLRTRLAGDIRSDALSRALYATDASIYEILPDGVVFPKTVEDVQAAVQTCAKHRVPITARGAGTGLTGGAVNRGLQLDCSRYLNRILHIDPDARFAVVQPGVVLDELNAALAPHDLHFAPDVATSSRATLGGMIANNSCGAHSVMYGRTVDHVLALDCVLSDGSRHTWGKSRLQVPTKAAARRPAKTDARRLQSAGFPSHRSDLAVACAKTLREVRRNCAAEIAARFPKIMRSSGGYALDRLRVHGAHVNAETLLCGSEGTLAIVVGAVLKLTPLPKQRGLVVAHFHDLLEALAAVPALLVRQPAAVELLDRLILDAARENPATKRRRWHIHGNPSGVLIIELVDDRAAALKKRLVAVAAEMKKHRAGYAWPILTDPADQDDLWHIRKNGLGLLMSTPGDRQTYDFVEDTAVAPARLRDYIARFMQVLDEENVAHASYYAHASVGCLHVKPILNLKSAGDVARMHRIADRISSLALEFGGAMTGEHGDGILRSTWLEKMYGPKISDAFRTIKAAFDPRCILNPGKIVDPLPMLANFRTGPAYRAARPLTLLDFSAHNGMAGLAEMCSGVGQCRQKLVGVMCPSYMATGDERHTTRARANALRLALSNRRLLDGLDEPALEEVMDLCISCKACKTECPTGVDMAKLKAEWLHQRYDRHAAPLRSHLIARAAQVCRVASRAPALFNWLAASTPVRAALDRWLEIDARVPLPPLARQTFRAWWKRRPISHNVVTAGIVALFIDTWTNYFTPSVGIAAVELLERLGYRVIVPDVVCCGRPAISKGLLPLARRLAVQNARRLARLAENAIPLVGLEPSCILTFVDEFPQFVPTRAAKRISHLATTIESFLARRLADHPTAGAADAPCTISNLSFVIGNSPTPDVLYHAHCHQKALVGTHDALAVLRAVFGDRAREINSGCCGMAGSFGHEKEHYAISRAIGDHRLFPAIRENPAAQVAVSGFSCRCQIAHHTAALPRHLVELVADRLLHSPAP